MHFHLTDSERKDLFLHVHHYDDQTKSDNSSVDEYYDYNQVVKSDEGPLKHIKGMIPIKDRAESLSFASMNDADMRDRQMSTSKNIHIEKDQDEDLHLHMHVHEDFKEEKF